TCRVNGATASFMAAGKGSEMTHGTLTVSTRVAASVTLSTAASEPLGGASTLTSTLFWTVWGPLTATRLSFHEPGRANVTRRSWVAAASLVTSIGRLSSRSQTQIWAFLTWPTTWNVAGA